MKVSTEATAKNIAKVLDVLETTPTELHKLTHDLSDEQINLPLGDGEWSCLQVMRHLHHTIDLSTTRIHYALMLENPTIPEVHAERDWGKLEPYHNLSFVELREFYRFKRVVLLQLLHNLTSEGWERPFFRGELRHNVHNIYRECRGMAYHEINHLTSFQEKFAQYF